MEKLIDELIEEYSSVKNVFQISKERDEKVTASLNYLKDNNHYLSTDYFNELLDGDYKGNLLELTNADLMTKASIAQLNKLKFNLKKIKKETLLTAEAESSIDHLITVASTLNRSQLSFHITIVTEISRIKQGLDELD